MADVDALLNAGSGLLFVALGILVLFVRPRRTANLVFAGFAVSWGARHFFENLWEAGIGPTDLLVYVSAAMQLAATVALVWLTVIFPKSPGPSERRSYWIAGGVGLVFLLPVLFVPMLMMDFVVDATIDMGVSVLAFVVFLETFFTMNAAQIYAIVLWTLRYFHVPADDGQTRRQYALLTASLVAWVGFLAGRGPNPDQSLIAGLRMADPGVLVVYAMPMLPLLAVAGLWLYAQHARPDARLGRNMAWFVLSVLLIGVLAGYWHPVGAFALTRVVGFALLTIAILRFQLLSIDVKIRWTVSRSTVAAAFIVVFFVASEAAAAFFGENFQNEYLGIAAAALLVLVLVPLQHLADRIASKAVPGPAGGLFDMGRAETTYRNAVRMAMANRQIDAEEEVQLAELADGLGISGARATQIRNEVAAGTTDRT